MIFGVRNDFPKVQWLSTYRRGKQIYKLLM